MSIRSHWSDMASVTTFDDVDGILVPGGFGERGSEGKIAAVRYARENKVPFFGICLGMQMAVVEFARSVCNIEEAYSSEFKEDAKNPVIHIMEKQKERSKGKGGTMRLGACPCTLQDETLARRIYGQENDEAERHRHRYEFNNAYRKRDWKNADCRFRVFTRTKIWSKLLKLPITPGFSAVSFTRNSNHDRWLRIRYLSHLSVPASRPGKTGKTREE